MQTIAVIMQADKTLSITRNVPTGEHIERYLEATALTIKTHAQGKKPHH